MVGVCRGRIMVYGGANCVYNAFADCYVIQVPTYYISYSYRRQTKNPCDLVMQCMSINIVPKGVILEKVKQWKEEGKNEFEIANKFAEPVYLNSIFLYMNSSDDYTLDYIYGIKYVFNPGLSNIIPYMELENCQASIEAYFAQYLKEDVRGINYNSILLNAY